MTVSDGLDFCALDRFYVSSCSFSFHRQYSKIYCLRFNFSRPCLVREAGRAWGAIDSERSDSHDLPIRSLNSLITNERCVIIGTIYKEMKLKPSILRELVASESNRTNVDLSTKQSNSPNCLISPDDTIFLEDDVQRILLIFATARMKQSLSSTNLATGVVVALLGLEPEKEPGSFYVEDARFIEPHPERPIVSLPANSISSSASCTEFRTSGPWVALVSGLGFTGDGPISQGHTLALQLLADWLRCSGDWSQTKTTESGVVRLMILGDSIQSSVTHSSTGPSASSFNQQARYLTRNTEADSVTAMSRLDAWLASLPLGPGHSSSSVVSDGLPVDLLPGCMDATSQLLPQQPIHSAAFPLAVARAGGVRHGGLCGRTNPFSCKLLNRRILATSGQGINDLALYTDLAQPCDRMEATLIWGHLAPTCPDTLPGYPLLTKDILLLEQQHEQNGMKSNSSADYPDIYVAGCQPGTRATWRRASLKWSERSAANASKEGALLVAVPRFCVSHTLVLVHLHTLDCRTVRFDTSALDEAQ
ncbi:hypothetical protein EG68_03393 [Paragonimus skrjabini miyazakii]|uniref:DNA polymerase delta small subunit n=1 Tax=Paragonimus skrjabini miyazakii TaxID=59628 RepID=A0A8S9Z8C9_9TREM|nr:hypothetical protein EG68_03393 [Paragonimus skrjabini miyazakii]